MAEVTPKRPDRLDPEQYLGLVRAALHPDERKFFKEYLGEESPGVMDYLAPQGRFDNARQIREGIVRSVLGEAIKPRATYGEAGELFPGFPGTTGTVGTGGTAPTTVPSGPATGGVANNVPSGMAITPIAPTAPVGVQPAAPPANPQSIFKYGIEQPPYQFGPNESGWADPPPIRDFNSSSILPNAQAAQATAPPTPGVDSDALLPRVHQELLNQRIHREGLRGFNPFTSSNRAFYNQQRLGELRSGEPEHYPGELADIEQILFYSKTAAPTSAVGQRQAVDVDIAKAKRTQEQAKAGVADEVAQAGLEKTKAQTADIQSNTLTENTLRQARLDKLIAQAELAEKQAALAGDQSASEIAKQRILKFNMLKHGLARGEIDPDEELALMNSILQGTDLEAVGNQPGAIRGFFGLPGKGVKVQPKGSTQPAPTAPATGNRQSKAKALFDSLGEGETGELDGKKFKRQGAKLIEVQ